ncbi:YfgM family protein [Thiomicrorhabdus arctica]|uniref:YfgM family protein n=1 Tax=Thiomicrorhabdus arctica TaxID=131540 RepID=UPI000362945F|nr:tetratricopeptide repeat protein [Thiomicrorhabdus arctica]
MSRYETEDEQLDAIKAWWKKNGSQLLTVILIAVLVFSGWRYWSNAKSVESTNASSLFEVLQGSMQQGTFGEVSREALKLVQEQPESPYAIGAAMLYAKYSLEKGDTDEAIQHLTWVSETAEDTQLRHLALLRVARIQADTNAFAAAEKNLNTLSQANLDRAEKANFDYVSGLVALAQGNEAVAQQAFEQVVTNVDTEKNLLGLAQVQLDDLSK